MIFRMGHLNRISDCLALGVLITALASLFYQEGGELVAFPGILLDLWINVIALLLTTGDDFPQVLSWSYYSVPFYSVLLYGLSWAYTGLREERASAIKAKTEIETKLRTAR